MTSYSRENVRDVENVGTENDVYRDKSLTPSKIKS